MQVSGLSRLSKAQLMPSYNDCVVLLSGFLSHVTKALPLKLSQKHNQMFSLITLLEKCSEKL